MNLDAARSMADGGRLYPSVILHGGDDTARREAVVDLARRLLCERPGDDPAAQCRHCRRLHPPGEGVGFHPDFQVLERDLRTATSVEATKSFLRGAQVAPFEARGQVFVIAAADSLSDEAANALLKSLEEPHLTAPRHFFLLAPSQFDLLATLRSRSLAIYLGTGERLDEEAVAGVASGFAEAVKAHARSGSSVDLLAAAAALQDAGNWQDPRAAEPWSVAAAAVRRAIDEPGAIDRRALLGLAQELLESRHLRLRGITAQRILEGLVVRHLGSARA
jgi:DNA polymerase III gamma/tau subunit